MGYTVCLVRASNLFKVDATGSTRHIPAAQISELIALQRSQTSELVKLPCVCNHPYDDRICVIQSALVTYEDLPSVAMQRKPSLKVFWISAVLLKPERPIVALEDVDAVIPGRTVERCGD